jgi:protein-glutamine gamma-glutamyltransferase
MRLPVTPVTGIALLAALAVLSVAAQLLHRSRRPAVPVMRTGREGAPLARYRGVLRPTAGALLAAAALLGLLALAQNPRGGTGRVDPAQLATGDRTASGYVDGPLSLRDRGRLPDTPLYRVPAGSPGLWRSGFLGTYTGEFWLPASEADDQVLGSGDVRPPASVDDPVPTDGAGRTDRVQPMGPIRLLVAPGVPSRITLDRDVPVVSDPGLGQLTVGADPVGYTVASTVRPDTADPATADRLGDTPGADLADRRWLDLPSSVTGRTRDLSARLLRAAPTRQDAVLAVESHLRSSYRYTLDSPVPAIDADAVDDFLFVSREGFCEQFASAEVVLLRAGGIPARLAVGFAGGEERGDTRLVRAREAHAWVEVWFPGHGWVSSDPTAGSIAKQSLTSTLQDWLAAHRWLLLALGIAMLLAGFVLRRLLRARAAGRGRAAPLPAGADADRLAALEALDRLEAALRTTGRPRLPAESLPRLADRLGGHPDAAGALAVYERMAFAARPPDPADSRWAAAALDRVSAHLLSEAVTRQGAPATAPR